MADRLALAQSQGHGPDLVGDGGRQENGRRDHRGGGVGNHRGGVDHAQAPDGRQLGQVPARHL